MATEEKKSMHGWADQDHVPGIKSELLELNMGPQHPATHGVLRLLVQTDGEIVYDAKPYIGYLHRCAEKIADQVLDTAAELLETDRKTLHLETEKVCDKSGKKSISFEEIATSATYNREQYQIQAQASYTCQQSPPPFIAQFAEVDVDTKTGRVEVVRFVSAADCGRPINPVLAEGQIEGAVVNGLSYALWEEYRYDENGRMTNPRFWDYKIFTAADSPELVTIIVDSHEETGPFGAKSVGEIAINGPAPAIANAIFDAVGVRIDEVPITPDRIRRAL